MVITILAIIIQLPNWFHASLSLHQGYHIYVYVYVYMHMHMHMYMYMYISYLKMPSASFFVVCSLKVLSLF